jgi:hypothetical protein
MPAKHDQIFEIGSYSSERHLLAALDSANGLVRSGAQYEIDLRTSAIAEKARIANLCAEGPQKMGGSQLKPSKSPRMPKGPRGLASNPPWMNLSSSDRKPRIDRHFPIAARSFEFSHSLLNLCTHKKGSLTLKI